VKAVAKAIEVPENTLKSLNPELRNNILPSEAYTLRVPVGKSDMLMARIDTIPIYSAPPPPKPSYAVNSIQKRHRVRKGESLSLIAKKYGVSMETIASANNLNKKNLIVSGQNLKIPSGKTTRAYSSRTPQKSIPEPVVQHVVNTGDSLWVLARKYGTTTEKIKKSNNLKTSALSIGQVLKIEGSSSTSSTKASQVAKYKVSRGDTPFSIAKRHNMRIERFLQLNQLHSNSKIFPGQSYYVE
jgi:membrane-bound lytic murein transglycosylase D